jgi:hypothetical protein
MSQTLNVRVNLSRILKDKVYEGKSGKLVDLTLYVNDEPDQYGNDVSVMMSQTKEERESKAPKQYIGNGKTLDLILGKKNTQEAVVDDGLDF